MGVVAKHKTCSLYVPYRACSPKQPNHPTTRCRFLFPAFATLLQLPASFQDDTRHNIRNTILEVLNRLPNNEVLRPYVVRCLVLSMKVLATDNEDNSLVALRIIFDLHKNFRPSLEAEVQPFLTFVRDL